MRCGLRSPQRSKQGSKSRICDRSWRLGLGRLLWGRRRRFISQRPQQLGEPPAPFRSGLRGCLCSGRTLGGCHAQTIEKFRRTGRCATAEYNFMDYRLGNRRRGRRLRNRLKLWSFRGPLGQKVRLGCGVRRLSSRFRHRHCPKDACCSKVLIGTGIIRPCRLWTTRSTRCRRFVHTCQASGSMRVA